jgi:cyclophilin family peptidyl-prolyl cis-trans isomerase
VRVALLFLVLALALLGAGCGSSSSDEATSTEATTEASTDTSTAGDATVGADGCTDVDVPPAREDGGQTAPTERLDPEKTYDLVVKTNCGSFTVRLDLEKAPATSASLVSLAKSGFYDDMIFHRIVPGFVIQGGDPTGTGEGGPGYKTVDRPPSDTSYGRGVVAMAKAGDEDPGTAGSQFFVVTGSSVGLPPDYAVLGHVNSGIEVVERIGSLGDASTEQPTQPVVVESVEIRES